MALDSAGEAYITGNTGSADFPITAGAFQTTYGGGVLTAFVTKLNASGTGLVYSTYLGGTSRDSGAGIAVDSSGNAYVTGLTESADFPIANAFRSTYRGGIDAFVTELKASGTGLVYSTYLGGSSEDSAAGIAVDSSGNAYVTGYTASSDFPVTSGAFQTKYGNVFVSKIAPLCSITYSGTFKGNLTISSGVVCIISGTVTGNVTENGGGP